MGSITLGKKKVLLLQQHMYYYEHSHHNNSNSNSSMLQYNTQHAIGAKSELHLYTVQILAMSDAPLLTPLLSLSNLNAKAYKLVIVLVMFLPLLPSFSLVDCCLKSSNCCSCCCRKRKLMRIQWQRSSSSSSFQPQPGYDAHNKINTLITVIT